MRAFKYIVSLVVVIILFIGFKKINTPEDQALEIVVDSTGREPSVLDQVLVLYDSLIENEMLRNQTVGGALTVVSGENIEFVKCYGVKNISNPEPINVNTVFRLASVSKSVTGILAGILNEEGLVDLDNKVIDYLPDFRLKDSVNTADLSVRTILNHTSGLVPHAYDNLAEAGIPFDIIMDSLQWVNISDKPGRLYGYQNVVFSIYDTLSSLITHKEFGDLLQDYLFNPFGMDKASSSFRAMSENSNIAFPHRRTKNGYKVLALNDRYYNTKPAVGINASISDMGNFVFSILREDSTVIKKRVIDSVFAKQIISPLKRSYFRQWDALDYKYYSLGWRIIGYKGREIAYHGGYVQGYRAEIAVCREENIGIVYLSNSPNISAAKSLPMFFNLYFKALDNSDLLEP